MATLLVIDEDRRVLAQYEAHAQGRGAVGLFTAPTLDHARAVLSEERVTTVVLDMELERGDTSAFVDELACRWPAVAVVVVTHDASPERTGSLEDRGVRRVFAKASSLTYVLAELEAHDFYAVTRRRAPEAPEFDETEGDIEDDFVARRTKRMAAGLAAAILMLLLVALLVLGR